MKIHTYRESTVCTYEELEEIENVGQYSTSYFVSKIFVTIDTDRCVSKSRVSLE